MLAHRGVQCSRVFAKKGQIRNAGDGSGQASQARHSAPDEVPRLEIPPDRLRGNRQRYAFNSFTFLSGRLRTGLPVAAAIALSTEGATTQIVGSPTPPQKSYVGTMTVSTFGISA